MKKTLKTFYGWRRPTTGSFLWVGWKYITYSLTIHGELFYDGLLIYINSLLDKHTAPTGNGWEPVYLILNPESANYDSKIAPTFLFH